MHHMTEYAPDKTVEYPSVVKYIWRITNRIPSILAQKYAGKFLLRHYVCLKVHSFPPGAFSENLLLFKRGNVRRKISVHICAPNRGCNVCVSLLLSLKLQEAELIYVTDKTESFDLSGKGSVTYTTHIPHTHPSLPVLATLALQLAMIKGHKKPTTIVQ